MTLQLDALARIYPGRRYYSIVVHSGVWRIGGIGMEGGWRAKHYGREKGLRPRDTQPPALVGGGR